MQGTVRMAAKTTSLPEYLPGAADGAAHVDALSTSLAAFGTALREGMEKSEQADDMATNDIFVEAARVVDKYTWFVEAHQQSAQSRPATNSRSAAKPRTRSASAG